MSLIYHVVAGVLWEQQQATVAQARQGWANHRAKVLNIWILIIYTFSLYFRSQSI